MGSVIVVLYEDYESTYLVGVAIDNTAACQLIDEDMLEHTDTDDGYEYRDRNKYYTYTKTVKGSI